MANPATTAKKVESSPAPNSVPVTLLVVPGGPGLGQLLWDRSPAGWPCTHAARGGRRDGYRGHRRLHRYRASARSEHWATALSREGRKILDRALPNDEDRLREVYQRLQAKGQVLVVAQDVGIPVGYLPGLSMRRIADLAPGSAKTDAKDAAVIAQAARSMPHPLRAVSASNEDAAALSMLTGFDLDLARQVHQTANRIRGQSFTQTPPRTGGRGGALAGRTTSPLEARRHLAHPS